MISKNKVARYCIQSKAGFSKSDIIEVNNLILTNLHHLSEGGYNLLHIRSINMMKGDLIIVKYNLRLELFKVMSVIEMLSGPVMIDIKTPSMNHTIKLMRNINELVFRKGVT